MVSGGQSPESGMTGSPDPAAAEIGQRLLAFLDMSKTEIPSQAGAGGKTPDELVDDLDDSDPLKKGLKEALAKLKKTRV